MTLVAAAVKQYGGLHVAVNNAGIGGPQAPVGEYPIEGWDKVIAINLSGVFYGMRYQIPAMLKAGGGSIINMASVLGQAGFRSTSAYVAAKHGVVGLTKAAALEYGTQKLRDTENQPGEWNHAEIRLEQRTLTVLVNGEVVNTATEVDDVPGAIGLKFEGGPLQYRNARITRLD